ncbi:MAG: hypothetical protein NVSMB10_18450 [Steroidobacteraceae bacterium]
MPDTERAVPTTSTVIVALAVPEVAVTVMVRLLGSEPAASVAVATPFVSVVGWVTATMPEEAEKLTAVFAKALLFEPCTRA